MTDLSKDRFIFLTTHYLEEAEMVADRIGILENGRLLALGSMDDLRKRVRHQYSVKAPKGVELPEVEGEVLVRKDGQVQIMTTQEEALHLSQILDREEGAVLIEPDRSGRHILRGRGGRNPERRRGRGKMRRIGGQLLASILVNAIYEMKNYPVVLLNTVLAPLSFLTLIWFVSQGSLLGPAIIGGLIMTMFSSGTSLQADLSHLKNDFKLQDMVVSSPTSASVYVVGIAISELIYSLPAIAILSTLFFFFVPVTLIQLGGIIVVLAFVFITSVSLGFALATLSSDIVQSFAFTRLLTTLFSTLAPVYYPITYIPMPYRYLAYLSPTTYAAQIAQNLSGVLTSSTEELMIDWTVLISLTLVFLWIGVSKSRWREK